MTIPWFLLKMLTLPWICAGVHIAEYLDSWWIQDRDIR